MDTQIPTNFFGLPFTPIENKPYTCTHKQHKHLSKMKTISIKALEKAIKTLNAKSPIVPDWGYLYCNNGRLHLRSNCMEVTLSVPYESPIDFAVSKSEFLDVISTFGDTFNIERTHVDKVKFFSGKTSVTLTEPESIDLQVASKVTEAMKLQAIMHDQDLEHIKIASKFVSDDDLRPVMKYVWLDNNHIVSTDGHRLYFKHLAGLDKEFSTSIHPIAIKIMDLYPEPWSLYSEADSHYITIINEDGVCISFKKLDDRFVKWQGILPKQENQPEVYTISKCEIISAIKKGGKFANQSSREMKIEFSSDTSKVNFSDIDLGKSYQTEILSRQLKGEGLEIGFNYNFFSECVAHMEGNITLEMSTSTRAAVINGEMLLMPVMLNR